MKQNCAVHLDLIPSACLAFVLLGCRDSGGSGGGEPRPLQFGVSGSDTVVVLALAVDGQGNRYFGGNILGSSPGDGVGFVTKMAASGRLVKTHEFSSNFGVDGLAIDAEGNLLATGTYAEAMTDRTIFAAKLSPHLDVTWGSEPRYPIAGGREIQSHGTAVDAAGNAYVVGDTSADLDGVPVQAGGDGFVIKYDPSGVRQWTTLLDFFHDQDIAYAVAFGDGALFVTGMTTVPGTENQSFLAKIDPADGTVVYKEAFGPDIADRFLLDVGLGIAVDPANHFVYVAGSAGPDTSYDVYLAKFSSTAGAFTQLDRIEFGTPGQDFARAVAVDATGNVYVTGEVSGSLDGLTFHGGSGDVFLVKYDSAGNRQWSRQFGGPGYDVGTALQASGGVIQVAGYTTGGIDGHSGSGDGFIAVYDADGLLE